MAITINGVPITPMPTAKKKKSGHTQPKMPAFSLNDPGQKVRISNFQHFMGGISHSAFHARQQRNLIPDPDGRDPNPFWWTETVKAFLQTFQRKFWQRYSKDTFRLY